MFKSKSKAARADAPAAAPAKRRSFLSGLGKGTPKANGAVEVPTNNEETYTQNGELNIGHVGEAIGAESQSASVPEAPAASVSPAANDPPPRDASPDVPETHDEPPRPMPPLTLSATTPLEEGYTFLRLAVPLRADGRLGIGLDSEFVVNQILEGGAGDLAGVEIDDQLVEVNGVSVFATDKKLAELMPPRGEALIIGLRRPPPAGDDAADAAAPPDAPAVNPPDVEDTKAAEELVATRAAYMRSNYKPARVVVLHRPNASVSLGMNVEYMELHGLPEITGMAPGGLTERTGEMIVGDVITAVNGVETALGPDALVGALSTAQGQVMITVRSVDGAPAAPAPPPPVVAAVTPPVEAAVTAEPSVPSAPATELPSSSAESKEVATAPLVNEAEVSALASSVAHEAVSEALSAPPTPALPPAAGPDELKAKAAAEEAKAEAERVAREAEAQRRAAEEHALKLAAELEAMRVEKRRIESEEAERRERERQEKMAREEAAAVQAEAERVEAAIAAAQEEAAEAKAEAAAVKVQAISRGRATRERVDLTKTYVDTMQAGQAANKAGEYEKARDLFLEAYEMTGRAEPRISATNMRLKLFEVDKAIEEYEDMLAHNAANPGFLSYTAIGVVQRKIADAKQLLTLMAENALREADSPSSGGGTKAMGTDPVQPVWNSIFACCNVRGKTPSMRMQPTAFTDERAMAEGRNPAVRAPRGPPDETSGGSPEGKPFDVFGGITKLFGANQHDVKLAL